MAPATNFDWVTARAECSLNVVFRSICLEIESDIAKRNALPGAGSPFVAKYDGDDLIVFKNIQRAPYFTFRQTEKSIEVVNGHTKVVRLSACLTLSDDGQCRLKIDDKECEFWQFRRRALEELFFGSVA